MQEVTEPKPTDENPDQGWYDYPGGLRYWDGDRWTDHYAPAPPDHSVPSNHLAKTLIWALALAFGVAGAVAWNAPVIAFFWPLGFGAAGVALSIVAVRLPGPTPWWALVAVLVSIAALIMGIAGQAELEDTRQNLFSAAP